MKPEFWLQAWEDGRRGFHLDRPNQRLCDHAASVFGGKGRILVPLCGATHDLQYLVDCGYEAVGVELSPIAARELADRDGLAPVSPTVFEKPGIRLVLGDFFDMTPEIVGPITGIWDRAALVALHPTQREAYVAKQRELLGSGTVLVNTMAYDQSHFDGPPWSVPAEAVEALWPGAKVLVEERQPAMPRFAEQGVSHIDVHLHVVEVG